jgi:hypothetical protein
MTLLDYGRHEGDEIIQDFGNTFFEKAKDASSLLVNKVVEVSRKYNVDPRYVWWVLFRKPRTWGSAAGSNETALDIVLNLYLQNARRPQVSERFEQLPESEQQTNSAISDLASWAATSFTQQLARIFLAESKAAARQLQQWAISSGQDIITERQAQTAAVNQLTLRIKDHPHWWQDSLTLDRIVNKLFG